MSRLSEISERALDLVNQAGSSFKHAVPSAGKLLQTGAALGMVKTGTRVASGFIRRNPVIAVAAAAGVGLLAYAAYRKRKQHAAITPIEGKSRHIEARKVSGNGRAAPARRSATGKIAAPTE